MTLAVDPASPLEIGAQTPAPGAVGVRHQPLSAAFTHSMTASTVTTATVLLETGAGAAVAAGVAYDPATRTAVLTPSSALDPLTLYRIRVLGGAAGVAADGRTLASDVTWTFTTAADDGRIANWGFEEGAGSGAADSTGNANHGTLLGGLAWSVGHSGSGLTFDGIDDRIEVGSSDTLMPTGGLTMAAWVKMGSEPAYHGILLKERPFYQLSYGLTREPGHIRATVGLTDGYLTVAAPAPAIADEWIHVAATFDGAELSIYLNGQWYASECGIGSDGIEHDRFETPDWNDATAFVSSNGGLIVHGGDNIVRRVDAPEGQSDWGIETTVGSYGQVLQDYDGLIYAIGRDESSARIDVINGETGALIRTVRTPNSTWESHVPCESGYGFSEEPSDVGSAVITSAGQFVATVGESHSVIHMCYPDDQPANSYSETRSILTLTSGMSPQWTVIATKNVVDESDVVPGYFGPDEVLADDIGGVVIRGEVEVNETTNEPKFMYVSFGGGTSIVPRPNDFRPEAVGEGGIAYGSNEQGDFVAMDVSSGSVMWQSPIAATVITPVAGGGVAVQDQSGQALKLGSNGAVLASGALNLSDPKPNVLGSFVGVDGAAVVSVRSIDSLPGFAAQSSASASSSRGMRSDGSYPNPELAVHAWFRFVYPRSIEAVKEWGGRICSRVPSHNLWSRIVMGAKDSVDVAGLTTCEPYGATVAWMHTHPPTEAAQPSGWVLGSPLPNDFNNALENPEFVFYLMAPTSLNAPPTSTQLFRYQKVPQVQFPQYNTFRYENGNWVHYPHPNQP